MKKWCKSIGVLVFVGSMFNVAQADDFFNGFETDDTCWSTVTRVASGAGSLGVTSATGGWHAETEPGAFTRWGGYGDDSDCDSTSASLLFPPYGYETSVDIYLDINGDFTNDSRMDFSSAINNEAGDHRRDFIISCGFYNDDRTGAGLGSGNRFICNAGNNSPGWPTDPSREPTVVATSSGWYTLHHYFYDDGTGVLAVDLSVISSDGSVIKTWTLSDPTDVINSTVGGNRYGWFINQGWGTLAIDDSQRTNLSAAVTPIPIPTLGQYSLAIMALFMMLGGFIGFRRLV